MNDEPINNPTINDNNNGSMAPNNENNNGANNGSNNGGEQKSNKFNNVLRLLFLFSFGAPAIFYLLQRNYQKVLWRKFDNEQLKTLQIVLSLLYPGFDRDYLLKVHVAKYNDASKIIGVSDREILDFIHQQPMFQKDKKFSLELYKDFIKKNDIIENNLIQTMGELLVIEKYYGSNKKKAVAIIDNILTNKIVNHLKNNNKKINYSLFFLQKDKIHSPFFSLKQQEEAYGQLKKKRKATILSPKEYQGTLITMDVNKYPIDVSEKEIENYYNTHQKIYKNQENLKTFIIFSRDKKELEKIISDFYNRQLSLKDISRQHETQEKIFNSVQDKEFSQLKNLYNQNGLNNFIINTIPQGFIAVAVIHQETIEVPLKNVRSIIIKKIQEQKLLNILNDEMIKIKASTEKYGGKPHTIKSKQDPIYSLRKNQFEIKDNKITIFIQKSVTPKKILSFKDSQQKVLEYLEKKYFKKKFQKLLEENVTNLKNHKSVNGQFFNKTEGSITLDNLNEKFKIAHLILQNVRNSYFTKKENIASNGLSWIDGKNVDSSMVKDFNQMVQEKEVEINLYNKVLYCYRMAKYEYKIVVAVKDIIDMLIN
jgi:hypothetical protein